MARRTGRHVSHRTVQPVADPTPIDDAPKINRPPLFLGASVRLATVGSPLLLRHVATCPTAWLTSPPSLSHPRSLGDAAPTCAKREAQEGVSRHDGLKTPLMFHKPRPEAAGGWTWPTQGRSSEIKQMGSLPRTLLQSNLKTPADGGPSTEPCHAETALQDDALPDPAPQALATITSAETVA